MKKSVAIAETCSKKQNFEAVRVDIFHHFSKTI